MTFHPAGGSTVDPGHAPGGPAGPGGPGFTPPTGPGGPGGPGGPSVPPPPPGPGAAPPFAAPPTERDKKRMWIGLGIGGAVLALCCAGGVAGLGVVVLSGVDQSKRQATATVGRYLDAIRAGNIPGARSQICDALPRGVSESELLSRARSTSFTSYTLGEAELTSTIDVPAVLSTPRGQVKQLYLVGSEGASSCIVDILPG